MRRALALLLVAALAFAGAASASKPKPRPAKPTARDRMAARQLANAADAFISGIDTLERGTLVTVKADYEQCAAAYGNKVDAARLTDLESFLAQARATASIPALWKKMVSRWDSLRVHNDTLKLVVSVAHTQAGQVRKLGQAPRQDGICDVLAGWEASGWANSYVTDMEQTWSDSIPVDGAIVQAARARVQAVTPQLRELGLGDAQIQNVLVAVL